MASPTNIYIYLPSSKSILTLIFFKISPMNKSNFLGGSFRVSQSKCLISQITIGLGDDHKKGEAFNDYCNVIEKKEHTKKEEEEE